MLDLTKLIIDYYKEKNLSIEEISEQLDTAKVEVLENFLNKKLYVNKKNGKIQLFDIDKILRSIKNAARDGEIDLSSSDISILKTDIEKILEDDGYKKVLESYRSYIKK